MRLPRPLGSDAGEAGFSLIEVMVAITVFALLSVAVVATLTQGLKLSRGGRDRVEAASAAESQLEAVRSQASANWGTVPLGSSTTVTPAGAYNTAFTITQTVTEVTDTDPATDPCAGGSSQIYKRVHLAVTWSNMGNTPTVVSDTDIAAKPSDIDPKTASIPVRVVGVANNPRSNLVVTLTGPTTVSEVTESHGCALFVTLPVGSYTATISQGGVGYAGDNPHAVVLPVATAGQHQSVTVVPYDLPTMMTYQGTTALASRPAAVPPAGSGLSAYPSPTGMGGGLAETNLNNPGYIVYGGTAGNSSLALPAEFPFADYALWSGGCPDADPASYGTSRSAVSATPGDTPGSTTVAAVHFTPISVAVAATTTPVVGTHLYAISGSNNCTVTAGSTQTDPFTGASQKGHEVLDLGILPASKTLYSSLPYGAWTIEAGTTTKSASSASATLKPNIPASATASEPATAFSVTLP